MDVVHARKDHFKGYERSGEPKLSCNTCVGCFNGSLVLGDVLMPTYEYQREDGTRFEHISSIKMVPLKTCPTTGQRVKLIITGSVGLAFKGTGFYSTDYKK
jgi:putative FmdB family regulatory protein